MASQSFSWQSIAAKLDKGLNPEGGAAICEKACHTFVAFSSDGD